MTMLETLEKRLEIHNAALAMNCSQAERAELEARVAEIRNLIFIIHAHTEINSVR